MGPTLIDVWLIGNYFIQAANYDMVGTAALLYE